MEWSGNLITVVMMLAQAVLAGAVSVGVVLLRHSFKTINDRQRDHAIRLQKLEEDAVSKVDWVREASITRKKLEQINGNVERLNGQNRSAVEIGAAIAAAMNKSR